MSTTQVDIPAKKRPAPVEALPDQALPAIEGQDVLVSVDPDESRRYAKRYRTTRWARIRATGRGPFLWSYGVLGFGVPLLISKIFLDLYMNHSLALLETAMSVILLPLCGLLIGYLTWSTSERRFCRKMRG